jgi:hypothetical protein
VPDLPQLKKLLRSSFRQVIILKFIENTIEKYSMVISQISAKNLPELKRQFFSVGDGDFYITQSESPEIVRQYDIDGDKTVELWEVMEGINRQRRQEIESRPWYRKVWDEFNEVKETPVFSKREIMVTKEVYRLAKGAFPGEKELDLDFEAENVFSEVTENFDQAFTFLFDCVKEKDFKRDILISCLSDYTADLAQKIKSRIGNLRADDREVKAGKWPIAMEIRGLWGDYHVYCTQHFGGELFVDTAYINYVYDRALKEGKKLIFVPERTIVREDKDSHSFLWVKDNYLLEIAPPGIHPPIWEFIWSNDIPVAHVDLLVDMQTKGKLDRQIYRADFRNIIAALKLKQLAREISETGQYPVFLVVYGCGHYEGLVQELAQDEASTRAKYLSFLSAMPFINSGTEPDFNRYFVAFPCGKTYHSELENIWPERSGD